jgi:WD40 repeat protein
MRRDSSGDRELALSPPACGGCLAIPASGGFYYKTVQSSALWYYDESTGRSVRILKPLPKRFNQFTISPDGKWFATDFSDGVSVNLMIMENFH